MRFATLDAAAAYAAGIIDGEGSVSTTVKHRAIRVSNTDPALLDAYCEALDALGIQWTRTSRDKANARSKPFEVVAIFGRRNLELALRYLPIQAPAKQRALAEAAGSFVLPNYYRRHEVTRETLVALVDRGLTQREIAAELGLKSHSNAQHHLDKHGLKTQRGQRMCGLL